MEAKKLFSRVGFGFALFFIFSTLAQLLVILLVTSAMDLLFQKKMDINVHMLISQVATYGFGFPFLYIWMERIPSWKKKKKEKLPLGQFLILVVFCYGITYMGNIVGQILMFVVGLITGAAADNPVAMVFGKLHPLSLFVSIVLVAPIMEEVVFRKLLIDRIVPHGQMASVLISGLTFGLFHGNFYQFFYACLLGMVFAYIYCKTGTIWYGVLLHGIVNFTGGFLPTYILADLDYENIAAIAGTILFAVFVLGTIIATIILTCIFVPNLKFFPAWADKPEKGLLKTVFSAPGTWAYLVICVVMFIFS